MTMYYPTIGEVIVSSRTGNKIVIGNKIGEGNFGIVYAAEDSWHNQLAVKVLKPTGTYEKVKQSCTNEIEKLYLFRHPFVTYLHDTFEYRNAFYIVTELCASSLKEMMLVKNFDGRVWLRPVARCVLQALDFIHKQGYLHQDIHAGNVFSTYVKDELLPSDHSALQFKVGDLGISRLISEVTSQSTMADWMRPPEVQTNGQCGKVDYHIDIYHVGLLFLQMVLGGNIRFTPQEILNGRPKEIALALKIAEADAIAKSLEVDPAKRYDSAMEFWGALDPVMWKP